MNDIVNKLYQSWFSKDYPKDWKVSRLKELISGIRKEKNKIENTQVISLTINGVKIKSNLSEGMNPKTYIGHQLVYPGDLVICLRDLDGPLLVGISEHYGCTSNLYMVLQIDGQNQYYYKYVFKTMDFLKVIDDFSYGMRHSYNISQFSQLILPAPQLHIQNKIVQRLILIEQKIDQLIHNQQQQIEKLKEYKKSLISSYFSNYVFDLLEHKEIKSKEAIPLNYISKIIRGNTPFKKDELLIEGELIGLQYGKTYKAEIVDESFNYYVDSKFYKEDQVVNKDDVIFISTSETIEDLGHACFYNRNEIGLLGGEQFAFKPNKYIVLGKFLYYCSVELSKHIKKYCTGLKVYRFNLTHLKNIYIDLPSIDFQEQVVRRLDKKIIAINSLLDIKQSKIDRLIDYKKSIIYEYVTGKKEVL